ncbi:MAG: 30S ribosomal protein S11, partial [uncultured bacterium]
DLKVDEKATEKGKASGKSRKGKSKKKISVANVYIQSSYNNTIVSVTDLSGNVVAWASAGSAGFKGAKKSTPFAASTVVKRVLENMRDSGLKQVNVIATGVGNGKESAIRAFGSSNIQVLSIRDITPVPHNGCRPRKIRRV